LPGTAHLAQAGRRFNIVPRTQAYLAQLLHCNVGMLDFQAVIACTTKIPIAPCIQGYLARTCIIPVFQGHLAQARYSFHIAACTQAYLAGLPCCNVGVLVFLAVIACTDNADSAVYP